ncbi:MAG TPA: NAD(P)-binding domain-containing protein, partial [bacterium]|nr:NAD(P)-binding domain-containing protein [bacterium]
MTHNPMRLLAEERTMIGIIGYGSMGGMLARGFVAAQAVPAAQLCIAARSAASRARATAELPGATVTADAAAVARQAGDHVVAAVRQIGGVERVDP